MARDESTMKSLIQGQLDRVDSALNTLVDSIASYNPSVFAATELLAADDELTKGIELCKLSIPTYLSTSTFVDVH